MLKRATVQQKEQNMAMFFVLFFLSLCFILISQGSAEMAGFRDSIDPGWRERLLPRDASEFIFQENNQGSLDETLPVG
jgi:hypothetical protein